MNYRAGYIGGDLSIAQREPYLALLRELPTVDVGARYQCRCGQTQRVMHRGCVYCPRCGLRPDSRSRVVAETHRLLAECQ